MKRQAKLMPMVLIVDLNGNYLPDLRSWIDVLSVLGKSGDGFLAVTGMALSTRSRAPELPVPDEPVHGFAGAGAGHRTGLGVRGMGCWVFTHMADRWRAAPTLATSNGDGPNSQEPTSAQPEAPIADNPEPVGNSVDRKSALVSEATPDSLAASDDGSAEAVTAPVTETPQDAPLQDAECGEGDDGGEDGPHAEGASDDSGDEDAAAPKAGAVRQAAPAQAIILPGEKKRLAPGALRQMIIDHLQAHPGEAFTATKISRVIEKSSGAIANALVTLARQGTAEQVSDKPRTYRLAAPEGNGQPTGHSKPGWFPRGLGTSPAAVRVFHTKRVKAGRPGVCGWLSAVAAVLSAAIAVCMACPAAITADEPRSAFGANAV
jgi:hypothetical protein